MTRSANRRWITPFAGGSWRWGPGPAARTQRSVRLLVACFLPANTLPRPRGMEAAMESGERAALKIMSADVNRVIHHMLDVITRVSDTDGPSRHCRASSSTILPVRRVTAWISRRPSRWPATRTCLIEGPAVEGYSYSEALRESEDVDVTHFARNLLIDTAIPNNAMNYVNPLTAEETQRLAAWLLQPQ